MARQIRKKSGTGVYHVMLRGINRQDIFEDEGDEPQGRVPVPHIEEWPVYYTTGNDMVLQAVHDSRGYLTRIDMLRNDNIIHRMTYNFEGSTGNLLSRSGMCSLPEAFAYDDLDRLTGVTMGGVTRSVSYHANGNISSKTNLGSFYYGSSHPHAVSGVGSQGNIPTASQMATYSPFGKVTTLSEDGYTMTFTYGPGEQRWKTKQIRGRFSDPSRT